MKTLRLFFTLFLFAALAARGADVRITDATTVTTMETGDKVLINDSGALRQITLGNISLLLTPTWSSLAGKPITITTASGATLTLAANTTLTTSHSITLATDGTGTRTLNIGAGGTLGTAAFTASGAYQAADAQLASLAALADGAGVLTNNGSGTLSWGAGGGTPGGTNGQIQFNNAGTFGGISTTGTGNVVRTSEPTLYLPQITGGSLEIAENGTAPGKIILHAGTTGMHSKIKAGAVTEQRELETPDKSGVIAVTTDVTASAVKRVAVVDETARLALTSAEVNVGDLVEEVGQAQIEDLIMTDDTAGDSNETYFTFFAKDGTEFNPWFDWDDNGTPPAVTNPIEVNISNNDLAGLKAQVVRDALNALPAFTARFENAVWDNAASPTARLRITNKEIGVCADASGSGSNTAEVIADGIDRSYRVYAVSINDTPSLASGEGFEMVTSSPLAALGLVSAAADTVPYFNGNGADTFPTTAFFRSLAAQNNASDFRNAISANGTVRSVGWTGGIVSVATPTTTPALTVAGTSGGVPYFSSGSTWASSAALAANSLVKGGGAGAAPSTITTGTGVLTALGVNIGNAGSMVLSNGSLGTPSSGTLTSCAGLPVSTGIAGLGTGVGTALGVAAGQYGGFAKVRQDYADFSTGSNDVWTATLSPVPGGYIEGQHYIFTAHTGNTGSVTIDFNGLGAQTIQKITSNGLVNLVAGDIKQYQIVELIKGTTGMQMVCPVSGDTLSPGTIELGHASDTTISRLSAGVAQIEGATIATLSASNTYTGTGNSFSGNSALSSPVVKWTGTWITGGTATTNKPHLLIEPTAATSTNWSTNGTGIGVNAETGFTGSLIDAQLNGAARFKVSSTGDVETVSFFTSSIASNSSNGFKIQNGTGNAVAWNGICSLKGGASAGTLVLINDTSTNAMTFQIVPDQATVPAATIKGGGGSGTDRAGGMLNIIGGASTGSGTGGSVVISTTPAGGSGSAANAAVARLTIAADGSATFTGSVAIGGGTPIVSSYSAVLSSYDVPSIGAGDTVNYPVTVTGATTTSVCVVTPSGSLPAGVPGPYAVPTATNTVTLYWPNPTASSQDPNVMSYRIEVFNF